MTTKMDSQIYEFLVDFGLTEREINLYLTLLKTGPNTIMNLARETGIKRSTTHNNVEELIKKGLVSQTNFGERRMVVAEDPAKLKFLMEQKRWNVQKLEDNLEDVVKGITALVPDAVVRNKVGVKYYEGKDGTGLIYKEAFNSNELRSYVNLSEVSKAFPQNAELFREAQAKNKDLKVWEIIEESNGGVDSAEDFAKNPNFKFKITPKSMNLSAVDILIFDNKVAMINFKESFSGIVIDNVDYYENSKAIFDFIWNIL